MASPRVPDSALLNLPREIRDLIFSYCAVYPDLSVLLSDHLEQARQSVRTHFEHGIQEGQLVRLFPWASFEQPEPLPMQTPAIFLVNRQVSAEAFAILHASTLLLDVTVPINNSQEHRAVFVTDFIGEGTLQSVRRCHLELDFTTTAKASGWYRLIRHLVDIWLAKNSLQSLTVNIEPHALAPFAAPNCEANTALLRKYIMSLVRCTPAFNHIPGLGLILVARGFV
ncbi:hypothetical protein E6O75_ATG00350 [Venturia nashicola]|uniref:Uncharacterized protein n=1 Tax=Venturia nashicola TaxID=86259 RepID=A0A4Z1PF46_9PEZI|nr:hypothetical protein E6O75_ATG00350 [Venturia nashicola]